jgi:hypothetical protein
VAGLQEAMLFDGWALYHVCFASEIVPYCLECDVRVVFGNGRHTAVRLPFGGLLAPTEGTDIFEKEGIQQEHGCLRGYITLCVQLAFRIVLCNRLLAVVLLRRFKILPLVITSYK